MRLSAKPLLALLLCLIVPAAGAAYWWWAVHPFESTDNAYLKAHITLVSPKEMGYVSAVLFQDNQQVKPGDVLVAIDDHDFQARVTQAEAQAAMENARIQTLETGKRAQGARVRQEEANMAAAAADLQRAAKDLQRFGNLAAEGAVSAQTRDSAESAHKQASAMQDKTRSARQEAETQLASLDAQIAEARARLQAAQAALELARIDLANTRITAPMAGVVGNRSVQVGQLVKPGSVLAYLIPSDGLFVEANFKETQLALMRPGQPVAIGIDAYPDRLFEGVLDSFAPAAGAEFSLLPPENASGNFTKIVRRVPVKIRFRLGSELAGLKPGLSATAKLRVR